MCTRSYISTLAHTLVHTYPHSRPLPPALYSYVWVFSHPWRLQSVHAHAVTHSHADTITLTHSLAERSHTIACTHITTRSHTLSCPAPSPHAHAQSVHTHGIPPVTRSYTHFHTGARAQAHAVTHPRAARRQSPCAPGPASQGCSPRPSKARSFEHPPGLASPGSYPEISNIGVPAVALQFQDSYQPSGGTLFCLKLRTGQNHLGLRDMRLQPGTCVLPAPTIWSLSPPAQPVRPPPPGGTLGEHLGTPGPQCPHL